MPSLIPWSPAPKPLAPELLAPKPLAPELLAPEPLGSEPLAPEPPAQLDPQRTFERQALLTVGTMLVSLAAYAWIWDWTFAAGFVVLLFVHELGHVIQLRREGIKASTPMFVPFMGALITARSLGDTAVAEARVGLAGPILGSIAAALCIPIWHITGSDMWRVLAFTGLLLNLFNLLPVVPLDGGRAMAAMAPWMWFLGLASMVPLAILFANPLIVAFILLAGLETATRWKRRRGGDDAQRTYYRVKPVDRALVTAVYLSLIGLLIVGMHATALTRTFG